MRRCIASITCYFDRIPFWADDPIGIQKQGEMLVPGDARLEYGNGHLRLTRDILELGNYLADGEFARVLLCGVVRPVQQDGDEIRYRSVLAENVVEGRVSWAAIQSRKNLRAGARAEANQP